MVFNIAWDESTNKDTFKTLLRKIFDNTQRQALVEYPEIMKDIKTSDEYEREMRMAGLEGMESIADGQEIPTTDPTYGSTKDWEQERWGLGFRVTAGMKKFNKWNLVAKMTRDLSKVMREGKDLQIARGWNNITSITATGCMTGFDGLAIASNSHTCIDDDQTEYDNYLDANLGLSSLQSATYYFDDLIDDMGMASPMIPNKLVVNTNLRLKARELIGTDKKPGTADNDINAIRDQYNLTSFVYHRYTSTTAWALLAFNDPNYDYKVFTSEEPNLITRDAPDNSLDTVVLSHQWFTYGVGDSRAVFFGDS